MIDWLLLYINGNEKLLMKNSPSFDGQGDTVIEFVNNTVCDSQLCFWPFGPISLFNYNITIKPQRDINAKQIDKIFIMCDSENSWTYTNWFCSSNYNNFACPMKQSKNYTVNDGVYISTTNFKPNTYLDVIQTYIYQENGAPNNVACMQYKAYLYGIKFQFKIDENECQKSSGQTLLNRLNQTHKQLRSAMLEMSNLFIGLIEQKIKFIELLENQAKTLLKKKRYPFFCPDYIRYSEELEQFKLKLKLENITDISHKIVDKKNLEPLIEYVDKLLQNQDEKLKQMEADGQFSKIDIIQHHIILLNSQKNSLKSIDLLNGDLKQAQQLITSTFLLIEELQCLLP
ncbi:hypothetical protein DERF_004319 [Dermatophagoides farinae]|uniref:Uncharacterized protein n=1 Tax=Dermatophagoides farinae TaxID=6954 RepID=A0A922I5U9_DERFA|nr:hypothetical protein DERF_004319 [Dermatophagoides farinae]